MSLQKTTQTTQSGLIESTQHSHTVRFGLFVIFTLGVAGWLLLLFDSGVLLSLVVGSFTGGWYGFFAN